MGWWGAPHPVKRGVKPVKVRKKPEELIAVGYTIVVFICSGLMLSYTFVHTANVLSSAINPPIFGWLAAAGIEISVLVLSLLHGLGKSHKLYIGLGLAIVLIISALAQVYSGYHAWMGEYPTVTNIQTLDPIQGMLLVSTTFVIPLLVFIMAEATSNSYVTIQTWATQAMTKEPLVITKEIPKPGLEFLPPVTRWPYKISSVTYFIQGDLPDVVKIGKTGNLFTRVQALQTSSSRPVSVVGWLEGDRESEIHAKFSSSRKRGEWFTLSSQLKTFILTDAQPPIETIDDEGTPETDLDLSVLSSQDTIEPTQTTSGYQCPGCNKIITSPQGYSGHIRFCVQYKSLNVNGQGNQEIVQPVSTNSNGKVIHPV